MASTLLVTLLATSCESPSPNPQVELDVNSLLDASALAEEPSEPEYRISTECQPDPADGYCIFVVPQEGEPAEPLLAMERSDWNEGEKMVMLDRDGDVWGAYARGRVESGTVRIGRVNASTVGHIRDLIQQAIATSSEVELPFPLPCHYDCVHLSYSAFSESGARMSLWLGGGDASRLHPVAPARTLIVFLRDLFRGAMQAPLIPPKRPSITRP